MKYLEQLITRKVVCILVTLSLCLGCSDRKGANTDSRETIPDTPGAPISATLYYVAFDSETIIATTPTSIQYPHSQYGFGYNVKFRLTDERLMRGILSCVHDYGEKREFDEDNVRLMLILSDRNNPYLVDSKGTVSWQGMSYTMQGDSFRRLKSLMDTAIAIAEKNGQLDIGGWKPRRTRPLQTVP